MTRIYRLIQFLFAAMFGIILILVLFFQAQTTYACKRSFLLPNGLLLLMGLLCSAVLSWACLRRYSAIEQKISVSSRQVLRVLTLLLFIGQLYVFYNTCFLPGWDAGIVLDAAKTIAEKNFVHQWDGYFSCYPNNIFITWVFSVILRCNNLFGIFPDDSGIMAIIAVQCAISCLTGYLTFGAAKDLTKSNTAAWAVWIFYVLLIGCSPWPIIAYSDSMGLIFPIALFRLYQLSDGRMHPLVNAGLFGAAAYWGFRVKPQIGVITIAIVLIEACRLLFCRRTKKQLAAGAARLLACGIAVLLCSVCFNQLLIPGMHIKLDPNIKAGVTHFFKMGLNSETDGVWNGDDVDVLVSQTTQKQQVTENLQIIRQRLSDYGIVGLAKHCAKKCLVNFGDGTFAWSVEGGFYKEIPADKNEYMSPRLKSILYNDGKYYPYYALMQQALWVFLLFCCGCAAVYFSRVGGRLQKEYAVVMLALIGIGLFEMLFEARARYLYTYAPLYIAAGALGWKGLLVMVPPKWQALKCRLKKLPKSDGA